jgi:hypothetical protein
LKLLAKAVLAIIWLIHEVIGTDQLPGKKVPEVHGDEVEV